MGDKGFEQELVEVGVVVDVWVFGGTSGRGGYGRGGDGSRLSCGGGGEGRGDARSSDAGLFDEALRVVCENVVEEVSDVVLLVFVRGAVESATGGDD